MGSTTEPALPSSMQSTITVLTLSLGLAVRLAGGQTTSTYDAQDVFSNEEAQLYVRADSLAPVSFNNLDNGMDHFP